MDTKENTNQHKHSNRPSNFPSPRPWSTSRSSMVLKRPGGSGPIRFWGLWGLQRAGPGIKSKCTKRDCIYSIQSNTFLLQVVHFADYKILEQKLGERKQGKGYGAEKIYLKSNLQYLVERLQPSLLNLLFRAKQ